MERQQVVDRARSSAWIDSEVNRLISERRRRDFSDLSRDPTTRLFMYKEEKGYNYLGDSLACIVKYPRNMGR